MSAWLAAILAATNPGPAQTPYNDMFGSFSPDGREIVFTSDRSGDPEIHVVGIDGTGLRRLTFAPGRDAHPAWSPDGRLIAFQSPRGDGDVRLFVMRPDGGEPRLLAATTGFCGVPAWSPDSRRIAFQCSSDLVRFGTPQAPWRLFVVNADGTRLEQVSEGPGNDQVPSWLPDGRRLLFHSDRGGVDQLFELELATRRVEAITSGPDSHHSASVANDGSLIALMKAAPGGAADVHTLDRRTGTLRRLTETGPQFGTPTFSPDRRFTLFQAPTPQGTRLHLIPTGGGPAVVLRTESR